MPSPYLYAALSIFPGLGLLALREHLKAIVSLLVVVVLGFSITWRTHELIEHLLFAFFILSWVYQIKMTFQIAQRKFLLETGEYNLRPTEKIVPPKSIPRMERGRYIWMEQIKQQLNPGEELLFGFNATKKSLSFPLNIAQTLVGVLNIGLIIIHLDILGQPIKAERFRLSEIEGFKLKGVINKEVRFWFLGERKPLSLLINSTFKDELVKLEKTFEHVNR